MKSSRLAATGLAAALVVLPARSFSAARSAAQQKEIAFESAGDFLKLPADIHLGEVAGVATTSTGNLWVYYQSGGPNATIGASRVYINGGARLFEFDRTGKFLREIGSSQRRAPLRASCSRRASGSIPRTTSGSWTAPPGWSSSSTRPATSS